MSAKEAETPTEIELKLAVLPRELPRLLRRLQRFGDGEIKPVDNVYYDSADRLLAQHGMALRLRHIGRRWLQTLKSNQDAAALSRRGEWEMPAPRGRLDLGRLADTPLGALLREHPQARLAPVFRTRFTRTLWRADSGAIEIALDQGEVVAGERTAPILELELELKSGAAAALYRVALVLAGKGDSALALLPAGESKAARGYRLAADVAPAPVKANAKAIVAALPPQTTAAAALRAVAERATNVLLANVAGLREAADPEFIHQARVAVRRLRSAARLFLKSADWPAALDRELRAVAQVLGAARDWDVMQHETLPVLAEQIDTATTQWLAGVAQRRRARAEQALSAALMAPRFALLGLRMLQWANSPPPSSSPSLAELAEKRVTRLHRRLFDKAAFFATLPPSAQHQVRIRAKRLRYALDLFAAELPPRSAQRYGKQLARVQDALGALNDAVVGAELLRELANRRASLKRAQRVLLHRRQELALQAEREIAGLARLRPPWC